MEAQSSISNARLWTGRVIGGLPALFLLVDGVAKFFKLEWVVTATTELVLCQSWIDG